jgi:hypothetical protein
MTAVVPIPKKAGHAKTKKQQVENLKIPLAVRMKKAIP